MSRTSQLGRSALRLLESIASAPRRVAAASRNDANALKQADLAVEDAGRLAITEAGHSFLARRRSSVRADIGPFREQHLSLADASRVPAQGAAGAAFDEAESPLLWLARRKAPDGRPLIEPHHLQAGERLRADFTMGQMMPRTTANWDCSISGRRRDGQSGGNLGERSIDARRRTRRALDDVGPEFAGLLLDVCCFLKRLEEVERERRWPARSAKVVLQLALERLARHYGYRGEITGKARAGLQIWLAEDASFSVGSG